jgi:hypothetical protein
MPSSTDRLTRLEAVVVDAVQEGAAGAESVLKALIRTRSASGAESTAADASSVVGKVFAAASGHGTVVESQPVSANSENVIEVLPGPGRHACVIEAHTDAVPEGQMQMWLDGDPYSAAEGWVEYLGDNRISLDMGSARFEATIRSRMSKAWKEYRAPGPRVADRRRPVLAQPPFNKLLFGTDAYGSPDLQWIAARATIDSLATVLDELVIVGSLGKEGAMSAAERILAGNARELDSL